MPQYCGYWRTLKLVKILKWGYWAPKLVKSRLTRIVKLVKTSFNMKYKADVWTFYWFIGKKSQSSTLKEWKYASVPVGHSVHFKECCENLDLILTKLSYADHEWIICGDLKVISMLLRNTKLPYFLCEWDSRAFT